MRSLVGESERRAPNGPAQRTPSCTPGVRLDCFARELTDRHPRTLCYEHREPCGRSSCLGPRPRRYDPRLDPRGKRPAHRGKGRAWQHVRRDSRDHRCGWRGRFSPLLAAIGAISALVAKFTIVVIRSEPKAPGSTRPCRDPRETRMRWRNTDECGYIASLNLIPSFGAFTRSCLVPRYLSVVWTEAWPRSNWICSSSPPAAGTISRRSGDSHGVRYRARRLRWRMAGAIATQPSRTDARPQSGPLDSQAETRIQSSRLPGRSTRQSPPLPRQASARSARARASRKDPRCTSGRPSVVCAPS